MNKTDFEKLLKIGYSVNEALSLLDSTEDNKAVDNKAKDNKAEDTKAEDTKAEDIKEVNKEVDIMTKFNETLNKALNEVNKKIEDLTKATQVNNIRKSNIETNEAKAQDFLAEWLNLGHKENTKEE